MKRWGGLVSRLLSLLIVLAYITGIGAMAGTLSAFKTLLGMLLPLACIWFPDAMGEYAGGRMTSPSPTSFVWFFGWVLLLLPMFIGTLLWLQGIPIYDWLV